MEQEKFKVLLYLKKGAIDKLGNSPIMGRITVGRSMAQFSCKLSCNAKLWNTRESRLNGKSKVAIATNAKIESLLLSIKEAYKSLLSRNKEFQAEDVKNLFQGGVENQMMLIQLIDQMTADVVARVGIDRAKTTPLSYHGVRRNLAEFIKLKFKTTDIAFGQLNEQFIRDFYDYTAIEKDYSVDTVRHYLALIKKACKIAFREGYSEKLHFANYPLPKQKFTPPRSLSRQEFEQIRDLEIPAIKERHRLVRDMFIFSCYVGTPFIDTVAITKKNLSTDDNGDLWLIYNRGKNKALSRVKLLPEAIQLIGKYHDDNRDKIFPTIKYDQVRYIMHTFRALIGKQDFLSYHQARHTFSSLITLEQGVSIETVSKMLGHSDIRTTQVYARVTPKKLFEDMDRYIEATKDIKLTL
ncbi:MAG: tyrosine-type recombinase/integrase [Rikenellaceae bacterium]